MAARRATTHFLEGLRNGGASAGAPILAPHTVDLVTTSQVGTLFSSDGRRFGVGSGTVDRYGADGTSSVGTFSRRAIEK